MLAASHGYLAFSSSFADEELLLPEAQRDVGYSSWQHRLGSDVISQMDNLGFDAVPGLFKAGRILQHALSWKHASVTASACPLQVWFPSLSLSVHCQLEERTCGVVGWCGRCCEGRHVHDFTDCGDLACWCRSILLQTLLAQLSVGGQQLRVHVLVWGSLCLLPCVWLNSSWPHSKRRRIHCRIVISFTATTRMFCHREFRTVGILKWTLCQMESLSMHRRIKSLHVLMRTSSVCLLSETCASELEGLSSHQKRRGAAISRYWM